MRSILSILCLALSAWPAAAAELPTGGDSDFKPLLDGKTFSGWQGNLDVFRIEDGAIVGGSLKQRVERNEFVTTTRDYADFELRLKFKLLGKGANAGVQIRSRRVPNHHEMIGYQADLGDGWWGCLYDESRRRKVLAGPARAERGKIIKPDDWNQYVIRSGAGGFNSGSTDSRRSITPSRTRRSSSAG